MSQNMKQTSTVVDTSKRPFSGRDILGYFMGDFGCSMSFSLISGYMLIFFTQFVGISLAHYAIIILLTKIWDGINDPLIGALIDRFAPKKGDKFRPWILKAGPILAFSAAIMFLDTRTWAYPAKLALCIIGYLIWDICYTLVNVPYGSLNSVITADEKQRTQLSSSRTFGSLIGGTVLGILIPMFAYGNKIIDGNAVSVFLGERMFPMALILGIGAVIAFLILYFNVEERIKHVQEGNEEEKFSYVDTLVGCFKNKAMLGLILAGLANTVFVLSSSQLSQMTFQMYFNNGKLSATSILTFLVPMIVGAIIAPKIISKVGKKRAIAIPSLITALVYGIMAILPIQNVLVWIVLQIVAVTFSCASLIVGWALVSDAIDYQEYQTGKRSEASIYATYSMIRKIGQGIGQALVPAIIAIVIPALSMSDSTTWLPQYSNTIKVLSVALPMVGYFLTFIAYQFIWPLDRKETDKMQKALGRM